MQLTQGDAAVLLLQATTVSDGALDPVDLTGATFESKITDSSGAVTTYDNLHHSIVTASSGLYNLSLSTTETAALAKGVASIATRVTQAGNPETFHFDWVLLVRSYP